MVKVTERHISKLRSLADKALARARAVREKGEEVMGTLTRTAVISGTAFGLGVVQGRTGGIELGPIPLDLAVAAAAHAGGFLGIAGKHSEQLHNVGDGAAALFAGTVGRGIGANWKATGKLSLAGAKVSGMLPAGMSGAESFSDQQLANAVLAR